MTRRRETPRRGLGLGVCDALLSRVGAFHGVAGLAAAALVAGGAVAAESPPAPVSAEPQQTSASFGDWVTRCARVTETAAKTICEVAQTLVLKGQQAPVAQIALARAEGAGFALTVLLPVSVAFDKQASLGIEGEEKVVKLVFKRCVPAGCIAEARLEPAYLAAMRVSPKAGKLTFADAAERVITLPFSFRGLAQALDDLNKHS